MTEPSDGEEPELRRLQRRLARQRRARLEAEAIAEESVARLYAINQELDRRIADRTRELDEARIAAERANEAKSQFLAHVSHEVRTPLNGISGLIELLAASDLGQQQQEWLESAAASAQRLARLFDRLLRYVELESFDSAGRGERRSVEVVLDSAAQRWRAPAAGASQLLSVESSVSVDTTVEATAELDLAIDELIENGITHGVAGALHLVGEPAQPGWVRIGVSDAGPGFVYEDVAGRGGFDPGATVTTRGDRGSGLGLALVERVATGFGGRLVVDAEPGRGSRVSLELPAQSAEGGAIR